MRRAEQAGLDVADLVLADGSILVRNGKRRKQHTVNLTPAGVLLVEAWLQVRARKQARSSARSARTAKSRSAAWEASRLPTILKRRQEQAGSATFTPHDLRRTFVSSLLEAGVDVFTVQNWPGHAEPATTARYDRRGETAKRKAAQSLSLPLCA